MDATVEITLEPLNVPINIAEETLKDDCCCDDKQVPPVGIRPCSCIELVKKLIMGDEDSVRSVTEMGDEASHLSSVCIDLLTSPYHRHPPNPNSSSSVMTSVVMLNTVRKL
jgi:hypothetical protein